MPCVRCSNQILDSTDSAEHLILNAIGGRCTVRGVLCRDCNSRAGALWDSELARQLAGLALLFGVERQDEAVTPPQKVQTSGGQSYWLHADGSMRLAKAPYQKVARLGGGFEIQLSPRSMSEARKILKGIAKKISRGQL